MTFYIPEKIKIGFQKRSDTFTGNLAFLTFYDKKGELRQEKSFNQWIDKKIPTIEIENLPQNNYVINKNIVRYGHWSGGNTKKVRVHDSRNFEFEISVENLINILLNCDVSKRDIQGDCIFAWDRANLVLLPINSEQYREAIAEKTKTNVNFSVKNLKKGHSYKIKGFNKNFIYLGYLDSFRNESNTGKKHIFYGEKQFIDFSAPSIVEETSSIISPNYSNLVESYINKNKNLSKNRFFLKKADNNTHVFYKKINYYSNEFLSLEFFLNEDGTVKNPRGTFSLKTVKNGKLNNNPTGAYSYDEENFKRNFEKILRQNNLIKGFTKENILPLIEEIKMKALWMEDENGHKTQINQ